MRPFAQEIDDAEDGNNAEDVGNHGNDARVEEVFERVDVVHEERGERSAVVFL